MQINSSSWFTNLRTGKVGLSKTTANKLSRILKHSPIESDYFETMVFFNQADSMEERQRFYRELMSLRRVKDARTIISDEYEYFATWHHAVIRAIVDQIDFRDDYKTLASMVRPAITPSQAKKSIELLEKLGLISRNDKGWFRVTSAALTTGFYGQSLAIANFQQEMLRLAQEAFDRYPRTERDISTLTIGISAKSVESIRALLAETRRKIVQIAVGDSGEDCVYQINMQVFPVGKVPTSIKG
jgi:uncharacterized protein (TIGR02147 family)